MDTPQQQLRLVGVHEDGEHLLLSSPDGAEFTLEITDALRAAATRPIGRPSAAAADEAATTTLSPKQIQAKIRSGLSVEHLAEQYGMDLERLRTYEVPVLAERHWIAAQVQNIEVSSPQPNNDLYRSVFGDEPALLGDMVRHRLTNLGLATSTAEWNAWREEGELAWTVSVDFAADGTSATSHAIGDQPPALWSFRPSAKHVDNLNRWAQVLSEMDPDQPAGNRRLSAVTDRPFDVEAGSPQDDDGEDGPRPALDSDSQEELLDVLHARRGQRLGVDEDSDDELALMLTREEHPATWTRPQLVVAEDQTDDNSGDHTDGPEQARDESDDGLTQLNTHTSLHTRQFEVPVSEQTDQSEQQQSRGPQNTEDTASADDEDQEISGQTDALDDMSDEDSAEGMKQARSDRRRKKSRPSVPSWDEIMFGTKSD